MVLPRLSICQLCAAPLPITSSTCSCPARPVWPKAMAFAQALHQAGNADLVHHFGQLAGAAVAQQREGLENACATGSAASNALWSPPHITVSKPFWAPAWPPDTGASTNCSALCRAAACNSRATLAEAVVWSTKIAPLAMPAKAPSSPRLPSPWSSPASRRAGHRHCRHSKTRSLRPARRRAVWRRWRSPRSGKLWSHAADLAALRLYTVTWWPARARWPAMG